MALSLPAVSPYPYMVTVVKCRYFFFQHINWKFKVNLVCICIFKRNLQNYVWLKLDSKQNERGKILAINNYHRH